MLTVDAMTPTEIAVAFRLRPTGICSIFVPSFSLHSGLSDLLGRRGARFSSLLILVYWQFVAVLNSNQLLMKFDREPYNNGITRLLPHHQASCVGLCSFTFFNSRKPFHSQSQKRLGPLLASFSSSTPSLPSSPRHP